MRKLFGFFATFFLVGLSLAEVCPDYVAVANLSVVQQKKCNIYFSPLTKIFEERGAKEVSRKKFPQILRLKQPGERYQEWIDLSRIASSHSWVRVDSLAFFEDFKQVSSCFPIASIDIKNVDGSWHWDFDRTGKAVAYDEPDVVLQAFYAKNMFLVRASKSDYLFSQMLVYVDPANEVFVPSEELGAEVNIERQLSEELKGCPAGPGVGR